MSKLLFSLLGISAAFATFADTVSDDGPCGDISGLADSTNRFVSAGGTWGANDQKYTTIQDAVSAAKKGDVIWIHDGFVCEPANASDCLGSGNSRRYFDVGKAVTLRSVSGDARTSANPPILRGRYHDPDADPVVKNGKNAIRIVGGVNGVTFAGLVFEYCGEDNYGNEGAGIYGSGYTLVGCVIRNCAARRGVLAQSFTMRDCILTNNVSPVYSGQKVTVSGTLFVGNLSTPVYLDASSDKGCVFTDCVFRNNDGSNGGICCPDEPVLVEDCRFEDNIARERGGAFCGKGTLRRCVMVRNRTYHNKGNFTGEGGAVCGISAATTRLEDCVVASNATEYVSSAHGGGIYKATAVNCRIVDNSAQGLGGGAYLSVLSDCEVRNNVAKNVSSSNGGLGGGIYGGSATNCVIAGNSTERISTSCGYGGGAWGASLCNCWVTNNTAAGSSGGVYVKSGTTGISLVNCLIADNVGQGGTGGVASDATDTIAVNCTIVGNTGTSYVGCYGLQMTNCIVWANTGTKDCHFRSQANCWTEDPKFVAGTYELAEDSPCVDKGAIQLWMHDTDNPASVALNGQERIIGYGPDIGAFERAQPDLPHTHIVQLDLGEHGYRIGGGDLLQMVPDGGAVILPEVKVEGLWKIVGWDQDIACVTFDMCAKAIWEAVDPTESFTVTFDTEGRGVRTGGGELVQHALYGGAAIAPEIAANEGWVFLGWTNDFSNIVADTTVRAKWRVDDGVTKLTDPSFRFVSADGDWGGNSQMYTSLQAAINAAKEGDTIYVQDGYVCDSGSTFSSKSDSRIYFDGSKRNLVVRTISGIVDEANGKGATIRGSKSEPLTRCLAASGGYMITFRGFIFEDGASAGGNSSSYGGGGVLGKVALYDCVVRNCSNCALSTSGTTVQRVIIEKCSSGGICNSTAAKGLRDCTFRNNTTSPLAWNGATEPWPVVSNCVFYGNSSHCEFSAHPSYHGGCEFRDCVWSNNTYKGYGGAIYGAARCYNCKFFRNVSWHDSSDSGGGAVSGYDPTTDYAALYDCEVAYCVTTNSNCSGNGGGVNYAQCFRTKIYGNIAEGSGGGAASSTLCDCEIYDNVAIHPARLGGSNGANGGGVYNCNMTNCIVRNNVCRNLGDHPSPGKGGGVCTTHTSSSGKDYWVTNVLYNCLIEGNADATGGAGGVYSNDKSLVRLVNCTVVSNKSSSCAGVRHCELINSIVWDNTGAASTVTAATNSCCKALADTVKYPGCITEDPRFYDDGSWTLRLRSPCKDTAMPLKWMTDPADARSKDLAGNDRVAGAGPDMGCYERPTKIGMVILVK